jgi:hypothetical protein
MATTKRLVPLAELGLRARLDANNKILGFIDEHGDDVYLTVTDDYGQIVKSDGTVTAFRSDALPVNTVVPALTGDGTVGVEITTNDGTWTTAEDITYTYQWYLDDVAIDGATEDAYTPLEAQIDADLTFVVTARSPAGAASATSLAVTVQAAP